MIPDPEGNPESRIIKMEEQETTMSIAEETLSTYQLQNCDRRSILCRQVLQIAARNELVSWWTTFRWNQTENQLSAINWNVDIVLTHTCPQKYVPIEAFLPGLDQSMVDHSTEEWLDKIEDQLNYKDWFCGHWHIDKRIDIMHFMMRSVEALWSKSSYR